MGSYEEQIIANAAALQLILNSTKNKGELTELVGDMLDSDIVDLFKGGTTLRTTFGVVKLAVLKGILPFAFAEDCLIKKDPGNTDYSIIEVNDVVFFKDADDNGEAVVLMGWTYKNTLTDNDKGNIANYDQEKILT